MPTVLLTRPARHSERLAKKLEQTGYDCLIAPMLTITPTHQAAPDLTKVSSVMITSGHVFDILQKDNVHIAALFSLPCYGVGTQTAAAARAFGFKNVHDAAGDGLALAELIMCTRPDSAAPILHICGHDIASAAADRLTQSDFTIRSWPVYSADPATTFPPNIIEELRKGKIDAALFFSMRTANAFKTLITHYGLESACNNMIAIGISADVINALSELPWHKITSAVLPTEESVLHCLHSLLPPDGLP